MEDEIGINNEQRDNKESCFEKNKYIPNQLKDGYHSWSAGTDHHSLPQRGDNRLNKYKKRYTDLSISLLGMCGQAKDNEHVSKLCMPSHTLVGQDTLWKPLFSVKN